MNKKVYTSAPLPFQGQKRRFATAFISALREVNAKGQVKIVIDLFGGSGLLSYTAKRILPECTVIYNDFDGYSERLRNIGGTNSLLSDIRSILGEYPKNEKIDSHYRDQIINRIEKEAKTGCVDYVTLSSSLLFSSKYVISLEQLKSQTLYNNVKSSDYEFDANEYLKGLDIVQCDYRELHQKYRDVPGVLFVVDPPYLSTDTKTYKSDKYWRLRDYLDVLNVLVGSNYVFFTSNKSSLIELCEWFADNGHIGNPFVDSVLRTQKITLNKTSGYTDMMLYKYLP